MGGVNHDEIVALLHPEFGPGSEFEAHISRLLILILILLDRFDCVCRGLPLNSRDF